MSENKRVTIPFLEKVLKPIVDLVHTKADKKDVYTKEDLAKVATSGSYTDLTNAPTLAAVATSGSYADLSDVPVPDATLSVEGSAADAKATGDAVEMARAKAEIAAMCPEALADPDVNILYMPGVTEIVAQEYIKTNDFDVAYFPDVVTIGDSAFMDTSNKGAKILRCAIFPKATVVNPRAFRGCVNLKYVHFPFMVEAGWGAFGGTGITHVDFPALETIGTGNSTGSTFSGCGSLVSINMPKLKSVYENGANQFYSNSKLTNVNLPELECVTESMFMRCSALTKLDLPKATEIGRHAFRQAGIETLILRSETVATLDYTNAFDSTPIASGTGYIYVPAALIDSYKVATNWSTYAAQFRALEDYTVDGTITGELNECKVYAKDEDDAMEMLVEMGILDPIQDEENNILTDEDGNIFTIE